MELKMVKPILTSRPQARPTDRGKAAWRRYSNGVVGFTLIELMVSVAIMAIIALAFGGLMTQANLVVTEGEKRMRSDAAASAVSRVIRGDIRKVTKNGFLRINDSKLVLVTAGRTQSSFGNYFGDGAIIVYGRHDASNILYRKVLVLSKDAPTAEANRLPDCLVWQDAGMTLAELQVLSAAEMTGLIDHVAEEPDSMDYPPKTLHQITKTMWTLLAGNCTDLNISYRPPKKTSWSGDTTCTRHSQTNWPDAIKFKFKLKPGTLISTAITDNEINNDEADDDEDEEDDDEVSYEIICPVGH